MAQKLQDIEKRLSLYKKGNHIPHVEIKKYNFDDIQREFDMKKTLIISVQKFRLNIMNIFLKFQTVQS